MSTRDLVTGAAVGAALLLFDLALTTRRHRQSDTLCPFVSRGSFMAESMLSQRAAPA